MILEYYKARPNLAVPHSEAVDWATQEWLKLTGNVLRDPDRAVRRMHQNGLLVKVDTGVYMYDPSSQAQRKLQDFTAPQKAEILLRDGYRCVVCGLGPSEGAVLHVDHIKPKDKNGQATVDNGQTLCGQHNFIKKNYSQVEAGKRFFVKMRAQAEKVGDQKMINFCNDILALYNNYGYDNQVKT